METFDIDATYNLTRIYIYISYGICVSTSSLYLNYRCFTFLGRPIHIAHSSSLLLCLSNWIPLAKQFT